MIQSVSIPYPILHKEILPYLKGEDLFSLSCVNKEIHHIVEEAIRDTVSLFYSYPTVLGKRLRKELCLAGDEFCKNSQKSRHVALRSLFRGGAVPEAIFLPGQFREAQRVKVNEKLAVKKHVTQQMNALTSRALTLLDEGFSYEVVHCLNQIRNRNRGKAFLSVFEKLLCEGKMKQTIEIAYSLKKEAQAEALAALGRAFQNKGSIEQIQDLIVCAEELEPLSSVVASYAPIQSENKLHLPLNFVHRLKDLLNIWHVGPEFLQEVRKNFLQGLAKLKKINLAQWIISEPSLSRDHEVLKLLEKPLFIAFIVEINRKILALSFLPDHDLYGNLFPLQENRGLILRVRELIELFPPTSLILVILENVLETLKIDGKEEEKEYIDVLELFKVV